MAITIRQNIARAALVLSICGLAASPALASAASNTAVTTINTSIGSAISVTSSGTVTLNITPTADGVVTSANDTVTVNTNNATGYTLKLADSDADNNLISGGNTIAPTGGTFAAPVALSANSWGYRVVGAGGFGATAYSGESNQANSTSTWAPVGSATTPQTIKTTGAIATNDTTTVWYGVKATASQPGGAYTDEVTYTATSN